MVRAATIVRIVGIVSLTVGTAAAQQPKVEQVRLRPISSFEGKDLYKAYCAQCHGPSGKGDGPRTGLKKQPADLTTIAARNGGQFSTEGVIQYIMGTRPGGRSQFDSVTGHVVVMMPDGPADMPSWGFIFRAFWPNEPQRFRLTKVTDYVKSLQQQ